MTENGKKWYELMPINENEMEVLFLDNQKTKRYQIVTFDQLKEKINHGESIDLDNCYIKDFSYKNICGLDYELKNFHACNTFFDGDVSFFKARFGDGDVSFTGSVFASGKVSFESAEFGKGNISFRRTSFGEDDKCFRATRFGEGDVDFSYAYFSDGDVSFSQTRYGTGTIKFMSAYFGEGEVDFSVANFGEGDVIFENTLFGKGEKNFRDIRKGVGLTSFNDAEFNDGNVSFSRARFGTGSVSFEACKFGEGEVDFSYVDFGEGDVYFDSCDLGIGNKIFTDIRKGNGLTSFENTNFNEGRVFFDGTDFGDGRVYFSDAKFGKGDISYRGVRFGGKMENPEFPGFAPIVSFYRAQFGEGNVGFIRAQFGKGIVDFSESHFGNSHVSFNSAVFGDRDIRFSKVNISDGKLTFCGTHFGNGNVLLDEATLNNTSVVFEDCILNSSVSLNQSEISKLVFLNCTNHDMIDFGKQSEPKVQMIAFFYHTNMGIIRLDWDVYKNSVLYYKDSTSGAATGETDDAVASDSKNTTTNEDAKGKIEPLIASELKMLKENYHNLGEYKWEDDTYVEFKRLETKQMSRINPKRWILSFLGHIGKYGTDPWSVFLFMFITVLIFALFYSMPFASIYPENILGHWWSPAYYSLITFLTIGYGDLSAQNGWTALACGIEGFLGVFLMSYFSVAVVRRILR